MTEQEWRMCVDPQAMLYFVYGKVSDRKMRLLAAACCRRLWPLLNSSVCRPAVDAIERSADNEAEVNELPGMRERAHRFAEETCRKAWPGPSTGELTDFALPGSPECELAYRECLQGSMVAHATGTSDRDLGMLLIYSTDCAGRELVGYRPTVDSQTRDEWQKIVKYDRRKLCVLFRDIILHPCRLTKVDPAWQTGTVTALAQAIYTDRAFDRMPILADGLEDAGCTDTAILKHCRGSGPHTRGCWVVDLLFGKE
jgi:hypothetical protein